MQQTLLCDICYMPFEHDEKALDNHNVTICQDCTWKSRKIWQYGESKMVKSKRKLDVSKWSMERFNKYMEKILAYPKKKRVKK